MAIPSFEVIHTTVKGRKCQYLGPWAMNPKTKDTMLSQSLKVEGKKVSLCAAITDATMYTFALRDPNLSV